MPRTNTTRLCTQESCFKKHHAIGLCLFHYDHSDDRLQKRRLRDKSRIRPHHPRKKLSLEEKKRRACESAKRWRLENPEKARELWRLDRSKRRALVAGARVEKHIRKKWISNWESRICGICGKHIQGAYHIDHKVPLSRGGEHSVNNLQLAHPYCNQSKFTKLQEELLVV